MAAMFGWFSEARVFASRWNRASRSASAANASGSTLMATCRVQVRVACAIHLAHSAFADLGGDFVGAEARARG